MPVQVHGRSSAQEESKVSLLKLTLDTNCIIALDEGRQPEAACLRSLLHKHDAGKVQLQLIATSASERQSRGPYLDNFSKFCTRLDALGIGHLPLLIPVLILDVSYVDWSMLADDKDLPVFEDIHSTLFPKQPYHLQDALAKAGPNADRVAIEHKWRNRQLDVHALWCHFHYKGDIFVTSDRNFHRKQESLQKFGATLILDPCRADGRVS